MLIRRVAIWSIFQATLRMGTSAISVKISALYLGPAGLALIGQLGNFISLTSGLLSNGLQTGIIQLLAESAGVESKRSILSTTLRLAVLIALIACLFILIFSKWLSRILLSDAAYWPIFSVFAVLLLPMMAASVILSALNGLRKINVLGSITAISTVVGAAAFAGLTYKYGLWGALVGSLFACMVPVFLICIMVFSRYLQNYSSITEREFSSSFDSRVASAIITLYPMLVIHVLAELITPLVVRSALVDKIGAHAAGLWQAGIRLSDAHMSFYTVMLSMYLTSYFSSKPKNEVNLEIVRTLSCLIPLMIATSSILWLVKDELIVFLLSKEFMILPKFWKFQLVGDVLKIGCWPLMTALIIKGKKYSYIAADLTTSVVQILLTNMFLFKLELSAPTLAYCITGGLTFGLLLYFHRRDCAL
jgi:O-antigen/teichoic acid export membrane protein